MGHYEGKSIVRTWLDGGKDVGESEAPIAKPQRALAPFPPNVTAAAFLADARFVLEEKANALVLCVH